MTNREARSTHHIGQVDAGIYSERQPSQLGFETTGYLEYGSATARDFHEARIALLRDPYIPRWIRAILRGS